MGGVNVDESRHAYIYSEDDDDYQRDVNFQDHQPVVSSKNEED